MSDFDTSIEFTAQTITFAGFLLRKDARLLLKDGVPQRIGERAFDLLCILASPPPRWHRSEALRRSVWGDADVGQNNLRVQVTGLRKIVGREAIGFQITKGYRFELPVALPVEADESPPRAAWLGNLTEDPLRLWGREAMLEALTQRVTETRLLTLKGVGGVGKTVLALACAQRCADRFPDGVWRVDLAPLASGSLVLGAVASALNRVLPEVEPGAALGSMLASQRLLLLLDNCEHVAPAVTELCDRLLRAAPRVHLLCTSRVPLKAAGEQLWPVGPLALPDNTELTTARLSGAVAMFEARAKAGDARFRLTSANIEAVVDICRRLDGLPFALVLAAARVPALGVGTLRERLNDCLSWATRGGLDPDARHLTLQATLDWSHGLLSAVEQQVFRRLGVFAGSFSLDAVLHVLIDDGLDATALLQALEGLVDHSLLVMDAAALVGGSDAPPRYTLHEAVRLDAGQRLQASGEALRLHAAHARHFLAVSQRWSRTATRDGGVQPQAFADLDNLRVALAWSKEHDTAQAMALCAASCFTWRKLGHHAEARRHITHLLARPRAPEQAVARADLLVGLCAIDFEHDALDQVMAGAAEAMQLLQGLDEPARWAHALAWQAAVHLNRAQLVEAAAAYKAVLGACRRANDALGIRDTLNNLGYTLQALGQYEQSRLCLQEATALHTRSGDEWGLLLVSENLGELEMSLGHHTEAILYFEAAVLAARRIRHLFRLAHNLVFLGLARRHAGQSQAARACLHEALQISEQQSFERLKADACSALAGALLDAGRPERALALVRAAERLRQRQKLNPFPFIDSEHKRTESLAAAALNPHAQHAARAEGDMLVMTEVVAWAMA